jgi:hypothetical protein
VKIRHPMTGALYQRLDDGRVQVDDADGSSGVFEADGTWSEGELRFADPHLIDFVSVHQPGRLS